MFFAKNLTKSQQKLDEGTEGFEDIHVELVRFNDAIKMARENKIVAMGSSLAILLLKEKIEKKEIKF